MGKVLRRITPADIQRPLVGRPQPATPTPSTVSSAINAPVRMRMHPVSPESSGRIVAKAATQPASIGASRHDEGQTKSPNGSAKESVRVGYCKPPPWGQFKKGQSGNPKGRSKANEHFATIVKEELATKVGVVEDGRRRNYTKLKIIVRTLANKAAKGDHRAITALLKLIEKIDPSAFIALAPYLGNGEQAAVRASRMKALVMEYFGPVADSALSKSSASRSTNASKPTQDGDEDNE